MESKPRAERNPERAQGQPEQHIAHAHKLLKQLQNKLERHPELEEAIETLEMALNTLTLKTGGML